MTDLKSVLEFIAKQEEKFLILPSNLKLTNFEFKELKALAKLQFPSIPVGILESLNPENPTYHP